MKSERYKGQIIEAAPEYTTDGWSVRVKFITHLEDSTNVVPYFTEDTFATEEEASKSSLQLGRQIIDGTAIPVTYQ